MVGVSMTDSQGNMKDALQIYSEVSKEYQKLDQLNKVIVAEGLAGKYHISRMSALLENMDLVNKMLSDSQNSSNSARIENEKYMQSLEARISKTKQAFEELALAVGEAFLTESFVQFLAVMKDIANVATNITSGFGALPVILGGVGAAAIFMSKGFRTAVVEMSILKAGATGLTITMNGLKTAFRGLLAATGVGIAFAAVGFGIEKLLVAVGKGRKELEEFERKNKEMMLSFKDNESSIMNLAQEYSKFDSQIKNGTFDSTDLDKYTQVSNELANLMPSLVIGEDQYGNKILASSEFVRAKTEQLQKQLEIQEKIDAREQKEQAQDDYETAKNNLKEYQEEQEKILDKLNEKLIYDKKNSGDSFFFNEKDITVKSIDEIIKKIDELEEKRANGSISKFETKELESLKDTYDQYDLLSLKVEEARNTLQNASVDMINSITLADSKMSTSAKSMANDFAVFVATSGEDAQKIDEILGSFGDNLTTNSSFKKTLNEYSGAIDQYRNDLERGLSEEQLEKSKNRAIQAFQEVKVALLGIAKDEGISDEAYSKLSTQLDQTANSSLNLNQAVEVLAQSTGKTKEELMAQLALTPDLTGEMSSLASATDDAATAQSKFTEAYENAISNITSLNGVLEELSESHQLSADSVGTIIEKYPELLSYMHDEQSLIEQIKSKVAEEEQAAKDAIYNKIKDSETYFSTLLKSNKSYFDNIFDLYNIDLSNAKTLANAKLQLEQGLLKQLAGSWAKYYQLQADGTAAISDQTIRGMMAGAIGSEETQQIISKQRQLNDTLKSLSGSLMDISVGAISTKTNFDDLGKSTSKSSKETERYTYVTDKFKQALEKLNAELAKQQAIQAKFPDHSKDYQSALKTELKLLEQKKKLLEDQSKALQSQIKSGKIQQTGMISTKIASTSTRATGGSNADTIWNYFKSKGFSDAIVAGIMGNLRLESNLNPNATNKSSGAFGIAQWLGGRKSGLQNYAKSIGSSANNLMTQLDFLWKELNSTEKKTLNWINSNPNSSASQMAAMFDKLFERSEGTHIPQRQNYANQYLNQYAGTVSASNVSKEVADSLSNIDEAKSELLQLQSDILDIQQQMEQLNMEIIQSGLAYYDNLIAGVDRHIQKIQSQMSLVEEGSLAYNQGLQFQIDKLEYQQTLIEQQRSYLEGQLKNTKLTKQQVAELTQKVSELTLQWYDVETAIQDVRNSVEELNQTIADETVDAMKQAYEQQRDIAIAEKQKELKQLEKLYDDYVKSIDDKLNQIDSEEDENDYQKELQKRQEEILKIQKQIDLLSLDNSYSAQSERKELEEELAKLKEDLGEFQHDREVELRKQNLQDLKDSEQEKYEAEQERINKSIEEVQWYYDELLANERHWSELHNQLMDGNLTQAKSLMQEFLQEFQSMNEQTAKDLGVRWQGLLNIIDSVNESSGNLSKISNPNSSASEQDIISQMRQNSQEWASANSERRSEIEAQNQLLGQSIGAAYDSSTGMWSKNGIRLFYPENEQKIVDKMKANSAAWSSADAQRRKELEEENQRLGKSLGAKYDSSKGYWYRNGLRLYHEGGIVGGKPTNRLTELANKLFNSKPNEQVVKALKGELFAPEKNMPNFFNNIGNLMNSFKPQTLVTDSGITIQRMDVRIENMQGGEQGVKEFFKHIEKKMYKR